MGIKAPYPPSPYPPKGPYECTSEAYEGGLWLPRHLPRGESTVKPRKLEHHSPPALEVKYKGS